jgi:hypothetical protein
MRGPYNDPDGAKWNALPRAKDEMSDVFQFFQHSNADTGGLCKVCREDVLWMHGSMALIDRFDEIADSLEERDNERKGETVYEAECHWNGEYYELIDVREPKP